MTDEKINVPADVFALEIRAVDGIVHLFKSGICDRHLVGGANGGDDALASLFAKETHGGVFEA